MIRLIRGKLPAWFIALAVFVSASLPSAGGAASAQRRRRAPTRRGVSAPARPANGPNADARVAQIASEYLRAHFAFNPTEATAHGLHEYDSQLETRDGEAVGREARRLRAALAELQRVPEWRLTSEARYDFLVLQAHARARLLELEEVRTWRRDPGLYTRLAAASVDNVLKREYAPGEQRLEAMLARERQIPRLLAEARQNLDNPPRLYTETAISEARGALDFFRRVVPQLIERAGGGRLTAARRAEIYATNDSVVAALAEFAAWLERDLLPRSQGAYALGEENFRRKLLYEEMIETPPSVLAREGERELRRTQEQMRDLAEEVAPGRGLAAALQLLAREHPSADALAGEARAELDRVRAFVRAQGLLTPPPGERLSVSETPPYERALRLASLDAPGPFERAAGEAFYYVTPPDPSLSVQQQQEHLARFNRYALTVASIHEAYPGHYYQRLALRRVASRVRAVFGAPSFVEGWAHYCEQMMFEEGFGGNDPKLRLAQLDAALLRLCRYLVALRMHTAGMTYEQAVEFFTREGGLARTNAEREARRAAHDPTGSLAYTLGKAEILRLREGWRRQLGDSFNLGEFHDRLLSYGMPPLRILRMAMLGEDGAAAARRGTDGPPGGAPSDESRPVDFTVLAQGTVSGHGGRRSLVVVSNDAEWRAQWAVFGAGRPLPEVNFNTRAVLVAYQGRQPTGGYGIFIKGVKTDGTVLAVSTEERRPASGDVTTQALTSPFVAASIPRPPSGVFVRFAEEAGGAVETPPNRKEIVKPRARGTRRRRGRGR